MARNTNGGVSVTSCPSTTDAAGRHARLGLNDAPDSTRDPLKPNVASVHHVHIALTTIDKLVAGSGTSKNASLKDLDREHLRLGTTDKTVRADPKGLRFAAHTKSLATHMISFLLKTDAGVEQLHLMGMRWDKIADSQIEKLLTKQAELRTKRTVIVTEGVTEDTQAKLDSLDEEIANLPSLYLSEEIGDTANRIANID